MSATDELRRLLDERGVEYEAERIDSSNYFTWGENDCYSYTEYPDGTVLRIWDCTPEQAIAATLGRGTCKNIAPVYLDFLCSECGFVHYIDDSNCTGDGNDWNYCPYCGARMERREE